MKKKPVNLALQGGGSHGAFTWGVIDEILADGRLEVEGISGTSAGAANAVLLADGLLDGGPKAASEKLGAFWKAISRDGNLPSAQRHILDRMFAAVPIDGTPMDVWFGAMQKMFSPYDLNPFDINPLKDVISHFVNFERLAASPGPALFVSATNVETGKLAVFERAKITCDAVVASTCLPTLFRAVEIGGVPYWDGGYLGNPAMFPLYRATTSEDILLVQINPVTRKGTPRTASEITNRMNEITFNSSLQSELRAIEFVSRLVEEGTLKRGRDKGKYKSIKVHRVALDESVEGLTASSKMATDFEFLLGLHGAGRRACRRFLDTHFDKIGVQGTLNLDAEIAAEWA